MGQCLDGALHCQEVGAISRAILQPRDETMDHILDQHKVPFHLGRIPERKAKLDRLAAKEVLLIPLRKDVPRVALVLRLRLSHNAFSSLWVM